VTVITLLLAVLWVAVESRCAWTIEMNIMYSKLVPAQLETC